MFSHSLKVDFINFKDYIILNVYFRKLNFVSIIAFMKYTPIHVSKCPFGTANFFCVCATSVLLRLLLGRPTAEWATIAIAAAAVY
jgi:hypothetical protein